MNITIGADPELFAKRDGQYVSAYNLVPGSKEHPHLVENGAVQVDGMALEFNINPADTEDGFIFNLTSVMQQLRELVPGYEVVPDPVATFTEEYMATQPEAALALGCDPDFNAWTGEVNTKPVATKPMRTGAGHVHIGWTEQGSGPEHVALCNAFVRQLDFYLGLPSLIFDKDVGRRELYGKAGACRYKPYGVEYRVLSNRWLADERLMRWVFTNTQKAILAFREKELSSVHGDIQGIINNSDVDAALAIIHQEGIVIPEVV